MAGRADLHADIALVRRARLEGVAAGANDVDFVVSGVNTSLHLVWGNPFETSSVPKTRTPVSPEGPRGRVAKRCNLRLKLTREAAGPQERDPATGRNRLL